MGTAKVERPHATMLSDLDSILGNVSKLYSMRSRDVCELQLTVHFTPEGPTGQEGLLGEWESEQDPGDPNSIHMHEDRKEWVLRTSSSSGWGADEFKRFTPKVLEKMHASERQDSEYKYVNPSRARVLQDYDAHHGSVKRAQRKMAERRKARSAPFGDKKRILASYLAGLDVGTRGDIARAEMAARREAEAKAMEVALGM